MQSRASSGPSIGVRCPGAALARYMSQYPLARALPSTDRGQSMSPALGAPISVASERLPGFPASRFSATLFGLRPRVAIGILGVRGALGPDLVVGAARLQRGLLARKCLPPQDGDIDVGRVEFDRVACTTRHLGRDDRRARPAERFVDRLTRRAVVLDRAPHALDGRCWAGSEAIGL